MKRRIAFNILKDFLVQPRKTVSRALAGPRAEKVFAIGFNKSATTSLHEIFIDLGYHSYHGTQWRDTSRPAIYRFYDAFCDDIPSNFRALDEMFSKAKFILQVRDLDTWLDSRLEHIKRLPKNKPRHPQWSVKESSVQAWIREWNEHHIDVLTHFRDRPEDLLLINYIRDPDAARKMAVFLGKSAEIEKPHANPNPGATKALKNREMITAAFGALGIPEAEWKNDIHCPSFSGADPTIIPTDTAQTKAAG